MERSYAKAPIVLFLKTLAWLVNCKQVIFSSSFPLSLLEEETMETNQFQFVERSSVHTYFV